MADLRWWGRDPVGFEIVLQQYEPYQYAADLNFVRDVTRVFVTANKPISVMSGHQCAFVPVGVLVCDYLMKHIPPISALGSHYVRELPPLSFMGRHTGYIFYVIATVSGMTHITISDGRTIQVSLSVGQFYQGDVNTNHTVITMSADKPVMVSQYAKGGHTDSNEGSTGDPFMTVIPLNAYSNNVTFPVATLPNNPQQSYISIITCYNAM